MNILEVSNALLQSDDEDDQDAVDALAALDDLANLSRRKAKRVRLRNREDYLYKEKYSSHVSVPMCPRWTHSCWWTKYFIGSEFILRPDDLLGTPSITILITRISSETLMCKIHRRTESFARGSVFPSGTSTN